MDWFYWYTNWLLGKDSSNFVSAIRKIPIFPSIFQYRLLWFQIPISCYYFQQLPAPSSVENTVSRPYFSKILKYHTENLHFSSTGKYYAPTPPPNCVKSRLEVNNNFTSIVTFINFISCFISYMGQSMESYILLSRSEFE